MPGDRLAGRAAMVDRGGRDVRDQLLGVQLAPGRGRAAAGPQGDRRHLRQRRPVHRRRPLHRRGGQAARPGRLPAVHGRAQRPAAGSGDRGGGLAGTVARAGRGPGAVAAAVARGAGRRPVLGPGVATTGVRADRLPDDAGRRLGRRLPQQLLPGAGAAGGAGVAAVPSLEPYGHRHSRPGRGSTWSRDGPLVGPLAPRPAQRRRRGPAGDRVRPPRTRPAPTSTSSRRTSRAAPPPAPPTCPALDRSQRPAADAASAGSTGWWCGRTSAPRPDQLRRASAVRAPVDQRRTTPGR